MEIDAPKDPSTGNGTSAAFRELNNRLESISGTSAALESISESNEGAASPRSARKRSILVVDDEPMALVLAKRFLSEAGFEVVTAQSGFECLDLFRKSPGHFDLILLDLTMPFMDGEETFGRLRSLLPDVVVLLTTGFIAQERVDRMLSAGVAGFLRKPHRPDELVEIIRGVLDSVKTSRAGCAAAAITSSR